jgi:AraC family transcriptional regulator of adaptative response / DNA-3-methyladenine glycosylase II
VQTAGIPTSAPGATINNSALSHCFPSAEELLAADLSAMPMPKPRQKALRALAEAAIADAHLFEPQKDVETTVARLRAIQGVGEWTAHYIALRAVREPDAFPANDAGLLRAAQNVFGFTTPRELLRRAERWRPFRAYAAQQLWATDATFRMPSPVFASKRKLR